MFNRCDFLLGENDSIVIVIPTQLPKSEPLRLEVHNDNLIFRSGEDQLADIHCKSREAITRLATKTRVGMIEFVNGKPSFPAYITAVASVEVMSGGR